MRNPLADFPFKVHQHNGDMGGAHINAQYFADIIIELKHHWFSSTGRKTNATFPHETAFNQNIDQRRDGGSTQFCDLNNFRAGNGAAVANQI